MSSLIDMEEVAKHNSPTDCWVVIHGVVYDLTNFHRNHPGGSQIIITNAGYEVSDIFDKHHNPDLAKNMMSKDSIIGQVDSSTITEQNTRLAPKPKPRQLPPAKPAADTGGEIQVWQKPPLSRMLNVFDFEGVAQRTMELQGWCYYSSGADDEITLRENHAAYQRVWLVPRVLVNVKTISTASRLLGTYASTLPVYFTATALGKLAHPDGEVAIVRAAQKKGVVYMLPTLSSCTVNEMLEARAPDQVVFSQLYVNPNRERTLEYITTMQAGGVKALFITVDAPQLGKREKDMRNKFSGAGADVQADDEEEGTVSRDEGVARAISSYIDTALEWDDLAWFHKHSTMPIFLKGIQCGEDAVNAWRAGCRGIVVSNHGGRQLDTARSAIEILPEVMAALRQVRYDPSAFEVYVDGGIRRGSDIFKAIALGATAVGIGRPVLFSLASYGQRGIERMVQLLQEELVMVMRLMGTPTIRDIAPKHVRTRNLQDHIAPVPRDHLVSGLYEPLVQQAKL